MARLAIALDRVRNGAGSGGTMPVASSIPDTAELLNTTGTSAQASATAANLQQYWIVTAVDGNIWINFGTNPTAASGSGWLIASGSTREFSVTVVGEKIAGIDA
jgi:hypothetical protein